MNTQAGDAHGWLCRDPPSDTIGPFGAEHTVDTTEVFAWSGTLVRDPAQVAQAVQAPARVAQVVQAPAPAVQAAQAPAPVALAVPARDADQQQVGRPPLGGLLTCATLNPLDAQISVSSRARARASCREEAPSLR